jgi:hypothetical protein
LVFYLRLKGENCLANLNTKIKARLVAFLEKGAPELLPEFVRADTEEY